MADPYVLTNARTMAISGMSCNRPDRGRGDAFQQKESIMIVEKVVYTARTRTSGGREGGMSRSSDGHLDVKTSLPGLGSGTNPEQLFAAAWSTCFISAIKIEAGKRTIQLPSVVAVDAEVDLGIGQGGYVLQARLNVRLPGVEPQAAQALAAAAHLICPYSKATHGNINVETQVSTEA
jgi:osmotically inducible protein OsmC